MFDRPRLPIIACPCTACNNFELPEYWYVNVLGLSAGIQSTDGTMSVLPSAVSVAPIAPQYKRRSALHGLRATSS